MGPYCEKNALDVAALQSGDLKPLEREHLTVGLVLELWKKKDSVKQMQRWITALTPVELQKYLRGVTSQNLNKACNDLLKKSQKLVKNKKKEELELLKQSLFHLPGSNAPMAREQLTPKSKAIAELKDENRGLKRSVSQCSSNFFPPILIFVFGPTICPWVSEDVLAPVSIQKLYIII